MWNGTMFVDLDGTLNASSLLSASAELLVEIRLVKTKCRMAWDYK